jgi:hypothetical protein
MWFQTQTAAHAVVSSNDNHGSWFRAKKVHIASHDSNHHHHQQQQHYPTILKKRRQTPKKKSFRNKQSVSGVRTPVRWYQTAFDGFQRLKQTVYY